MWDFFKKEVNDDKLKLQKQTKRQFCLNVAIFNLTPHASKKFVTFMTSICFYEKAKKISTKSRQTKRQIFQKLGTNIFAHVIQVFLVYACFSG